MGQDCVDGVVVPAQFLFAGNQPVDTAMTVSANRDRLLHLLSSEAFLKPLVRVHGSGDQVVLGRPLAHHSVTQPAGASIASCAVTFAHFFNRSSAAAVIVITPVRSEGSTSG